MSRRIELSNEYLTAVFMAYFKEAIKPKLVEMANSKQAPTTDSVIHSFTVDWGDICTKMEYRIVSSDRRTKASKRYYWLFICPSESDNIYECPQISPESLIKKMLIQHPKQPLINLFSYMLKEYLSREYLCVIDEKGFYWELGDEDGMAVLKAAFKSACLRAYGKTVQPATFITVSERRQENEIVDAETFHKQFFTGLRDDRFPSSIDLFRQIKRMWKIHYNENEISISVAASLFESLDDRKKIKSRILSEACLFPLFNSLLESGKYGELHNLLRELCSFSIYFDGNSLLVDIEVQPPVQAIAERIIAPVRQCLPSKEYTAYDYIMVLGKYAKIAGEIQNIHCFWEDEISSEDVPYIQDAVINRLINVFNDDGRKRYKFRLKQFRLFTAAMASALNDNARWRSSPNYPRIQEGLNRLLKMQGTEREMIQNKAEGHYAHYYSAEAFYSVCFLMYTDSNNKRDIIDGLMNVASNFHINGDTRTRQEKAISILTYLLLENGHEFSGGYRQQMFDRAFGQTLYKQQSEMWRLLKSQSAFYSRYAKDQFRKACELQQSPNCLQVMESERYASAQPYFNFLQADLYTEEELATAPEALQTFLQCCSIQRDTWFLSNHNPAVSQSFIDKAFLLIDRCVSRIKLEPNSDDIMFYIYGLSMVFYGLANIKYQRLSECSNLVEEKIKTHRTGDSPIFEAVLLCDYWNRRKNSIYDNGKLKEEYYLLAGAIRFICSYDLSDSMTEKYQVELLPSLNVKQYYEKWLGAQKREDLRYYYLMLRLLSYTDFNILPFVNRQEFSRTEFLPYDNFPSSYTDFYNNPQKISRL